MSSGSKVVYFKNREDSALTSEKREKIRKSVISLADDYLSKIFSQVLDNVDDSFFDIAEKSTSTTEQTLYFDAMRELRKKRDTASKTFKELLTESLRKLDTLNIAENAAFPGTHNLPIEEDELSLIQNDQLEESLAQSSIYTKARLRCSRQLTALEVRIGNLFNNNEIDEENNPLDPQQIVNIFSNATEAIDLDLKTRIILYKHFDKVIAKNLMAFYEKINEILISAGIAPDLKAVPLKPNSPSSNSSGSENTGPSQQKEHQAVSLNHDDDDLFNVLSELLTKRRSLSLPAADNTIGTTENTPSLSSSEIIYALSELQQNSLSAPSPNSLINDDQIKNMILSSDRVRAKIPAGTPNNSVRFERAQSDVIDIVNMLFEFILGDPDLSDSIKAQIGRLQVPVLKVAILDNSFFSNSTHPARLLINDLARAAIGWADTNTQDNLLQKIEAIVGELLSNFGDDPSIFSRLHADFLGFLELEKKRANTIEARTRKVEESKTKVEYAKKLVRKEIDQRIEGHYLSDAVSSLINDGWFKYLFITYLKEGDESESWKTGLQTLDQLLWTLEPKNSEDDRGRLLSTIPKMQRALREGLNHILFNPFEITKLFRELEISHVACLRETDEMIKRSESDSASVDAEPETGFQAETVDKDQPTEASTSKAITEETSSQNTDTADFVFFAEKDEKNIEPASTHEPETPIASEIDAPSSQEEPATSLTDTVDPVVTDTDLTTEVSESVSEETGTDTVEEIVPNVQETSLNEENSAPDIPTLDEAVSCDQENSFAHQLESLEVGTWFEFKDSNGSSVRAKLSAKLNKGNRLIFVNRSGFKLADKTREQLIEELENGTTSILDDNLLFDRALESVISNLREMRGSQD